MKPKFVVGGVVIAMALGYMIWAGVSQSVVYFVTPSELSAAPVAGKAYRLGGLVERGSLKWEPTTSVEELAKFAEKFPQATMREFDGRGHQFNHDLSEVAEDIKGLGVSSGF